MSEPEPPIQSSIDRLQQELAELRNTFSQRADELEAELQAVRQLAQAEKASAEPPDSISVAQASAQPQEDSQVADNQATESAIPSSPVTHDDSIDARDDPWHSDDLSWHSSDEPAQPKPPGFLQILLSSLLQSLAGFLLNLLGVVKSPFQQVLEKLFDLYRHYQQQGKAPVFLMTVAGLVTLTFGFGYLLQYSFTYWFSDTFKAISGFVIGGTITALGVWLATRKKEFAEYAASVIALGIVFCYLTAYFVGPYYGLVGETGGFVLLAVVTAIAFVLARVFETSVVSAVTLVGGVFMPFIIGDASAAGLGFVAYLLLLSTGNLYLSRKISWPLLAQLTFALNLSVIEYVGISMAANTLAALGLLSAFFLLFSYFWLFDGWALREKLSAKTLAILVANVFYFLYATLQLNAPVMMVAADFIVLAALFIALMKVLRLLQSHAAPIVVLYIGLLLASAIFVLSPADVSSILWALEGLAMLAIGFHYRHKMIRVEGYSIYVLAMLSLLWQAVDAFMLMKPGPIGWHWVNLLAFGALSFAAYRIIEHFKQDASTAEMKAGFVQNEIFTLWGVLALYLVMGVAFDLSVSTTLVLTIIPVGWCFYRVAVHRLRFTQLVGFMLMLAFLLQILGAALDTGSLLISRQPVWSWLAMFEWLAVAWALHFLFRHFEIEGRGARWAAKLHHSVFYIPALLIVLGWNNIVETSQDFTGELSFGYAWFDLWINAALIAVLLWLKSKTEKPQAGQTRSRHRQLLLESASFLGALLFLYSVAIIGGAWVFNAAGLSLLALLIIGVKYHLPWTEKLAWGHFLLFAVMAYQAWLEVGNLHFSEQSWATRIGLIELLLSAWAVQAIYQYLRAEQGGLQWARRLRIGVYCVIPLLFLPRIWRLYPEYFATALWVSFTIDWLLFKKLKIEALRRELEILFLAAVAATVWIALAAISGAQQLPGLIAICSGMALLLVFHRVEKTLAQRTLMASPYLRIQLASPYFFAIAISGLSFAAARDLLLALLLAGLYFVGIIVAGRLRVMLRPTLLIAFALAWVLLATIPLLSLLVASVNGFMPGDFFLLLWNILAVAGLWMLTHYASPVLHCLRARYARGIVPLWAFHGIVVLAYSAVLNQWFGAWNVALSIALLVHAVVVLMLTLKPQYKGLLKLSILLYGLTASKVLFYDMSGAGNLQKVFALMGIGSILMAAAYLFQKMRLRAQTVNQERP